MDQSSEHKEFHQTCSSHDSESDSNCNINHPENAMRDCNVARESTVTDMGIANLDATEQVGNASNATAERIGLASEATAQRMALAELDAVGRVKDEVCASSRDIIAAVEREGNENLNATRAFGLSNQAESERMGIMNRDATERLGLHNSEVTINEAQLTQSAVGRTADRTQDAIYQSASKTQAEVERFGLSELEAIRGSEKYLYSGLSQYAKDILLFNANEFERVKLQAAADTASIKQQQCDDTKQILLQNCDATDKVLLQSASHFKDLLLQNCNNTDKVMQQSASHFKDILLQNCNDTAAIKMQAEIHAKDAALAAKDLTHQADKNAAAIQIEALRNKEELARQIAECCCENKALIIEKANHTDDLIRKLDEQRVRDELAKTREELIALRVRASLPPPPVASVCL